MSACKGTKQWCWWDRGAARVFCNPAAPAHVRALNSEGSVPRAAGAWLSLARVQHQTPGGARRAPQLTWRVGVAAAFRLCWASRSSHQRRAPVLHPLLWQRQDPLPLTSALQSDLPWALLSSSPHSPALCCDPAPLADFCTWPSASPWAAWPGLCSARWQESVVQEGEECLALKIH